jgi:hypothetical protein
VSATGLSRQPAEVIEFLCGNCLSGRWHNFRYSRRLKVKPRYRKMSGAAFDGRNPRGLQSGDGLSLIALTRRLALGEFNTFANGGVISRPKKTLANRAVGPQIT